MNKIRQCVSRKILLCRVLQKIDLTGIPTVRNVMEINCTSKTWKLRGNLTEILMEMLNRNVTGNKYEISRITGNNPEILKRNGNSGQNPGNSGQSM